MRVKRQTDWMPCSSASAMSAARMRLPAPWLLAAGMTAMERTSQRCGPEKCSPPQPRKTPPSDKATVKSRMSSQTSAKERWISVPSGASALTRSQTLAASVSRALRTTMNDLLSHSGDPIRCGGQGFPHTFACGPSCYVVAVERGRERDSVKKIFLELFAKLAEFVKGEGIEFNVFLDGEAYGIADLLMSGAEGDALVDKKIGRAHAGT